MAEPQVKVEPFQNRGLDLRKEPSSLAAGEYSVLTNVVSNQEGEMAIRAGTCRQSNSGSFSNESIVHTISKMHQGPGQDTYYFGAAGHIWRTSQSLPVSGAALAPTRVGNNAAPLGTAYTKQRITPATFNSGATGSPYEYFACPSKMLKDTGSLVSGDGTSDGTIIQKWGILPPVQPAVVTLDQLTILPANVDMVAAAAGAMYDRLSTSINAAPTGPTAGPGYFTCPVGDITSIFVGTMLKVAGELVIVSQTTANSATSGNPNDTSGTFSAYFTGTPANGNTVVSAEKHQSLADTPTSTLFDFQTAIPGAGFNGQPPDYTSADIVHVAIGIAEPSKIADIRVRVMVGASYNASGADYYEKSIALSAVQPVTSLTQTATTNLSGTIPQTVIGARGPYPPPDEPTQQAKAKELGTTSPNQNVANFVFTEIDIPKETLLPVGQAGKSHFTWQNVQGIQIVAVSSVKAPTSAPTVWVSSVYIAGGFGPDALSQDANIILQPYDYLYCYVNPSTGAKSNPSVPMIQSNWVTPHRQRVAVSVGGTIDPQVIVGTGAVQVGNSSIAIYRRGGSFSDGLYRLVGYTSNPGVDGSNGFPKTTIFYDDQSDLDLLDADLIEFDNDAPVTSTLTSPARLEMGGFIGGGKGAAGQLSYVVLAPINDLPTPFISDFIHDGTVLTIRRGSQKEETCIAYQVGQAGPGVVLLYFQKDQTDMATLPPLTVVADCDTTANQPCPLAVSAFDSVFVAGDPNNPHVVYKSKTGRPESFPTVELATGIVNTQNVGTPSNPIVNFCEYGGGLLFLNLRSLYFMSVAFGVMETPIETPAARGLIGRNAWCKVDNEIWYVSYDGIYSWSGGQSVKRSIELDPLFRGQSIGPYNPIQFGAPNPAVPTLLGSDIITMAYQDNQVFVVYVDSIGDYYRLRYDTIFQRWSIDYFWDAFNPPPPPQLPIPGNTVLEAVTAQYVDKDTGNFLVARTGAGTIAYIYLDELGTSDGWVNNGNPGDGSTGGPIPFTIGTPSFTFGAPSLNKQYLDFVLDINNDSMQNLNWQVYTNFAGPFGTPTESGSFQAPTPGTGRHQVPVALNGGYGWEAYAISFVFQGYSNKPIKFYSITFNYIVLTQVQSGRTWDWDELGWRYDKRLYQVIFEYDIPVGQSVTMILDTITGIAGAQQENAAVQTFALTPPSSGSSGAPTRLTANFFLNDVMIVKKIRIRPTLTNPAGGVTSSNPVLFKYFSYTFGEFEKLPADIVAFTPWNNYGTEYDKYAQQIDLNVDTGGVPGTCTLEADGVAVAGPFPVTTTSENRQVNLTMPPQIKGKMFRLVNTAGMGGKFQLYDHRIIMLPADRGPVLQTWDWSYLGWPFDKKLKRFTVEYNTQNTPTTILIDTMTGIKGGTINTAAFSFVLDQPGRALQTFPFPDGVYVKQLRMYPQSDNVVFKEWQPTWDKDNYPADIFEFTDWSDLGWPCQKILRSLEIEMDTGGVAATIQIQADGANVGVPISITTTATNRRQIISLPSDIVGINFRLLFTPGTNGKTQYFSHEWEAIREPCAVTHWDSYEVAFSYNGWSFIKQMWLQYICPANVTVSIYSDGGNLFFQQVLPPHALRDTERFYLPAIQFTNGLAVLNKSKRHRIQIDSFSPFKFYLEQSKIEWMPIAAEQRQAYQQMTFSAIMAIQTAFGVEEAQTPNKSPAISSGFSGMLVTQTADQ